jgi:uncharacterized membrane protein
VIIELAADRSAFVCAAAALVLATHITAGGVGLASGAVALCARKGEALHRRAGTWFFVSMLTMSAVGAGAAMFLPQRPSVLVGVFTFYLVATAWAAAKHRSPGVGRFERAAAGVAVLLVVGFAVLGALALQSADGRLDGLPGAPNFVFGALALIAAAGDLKLIRRGRLDGTSRIARHLWRMSLALLIAAASFFLGQPQAFPPALRGSPVLFLPELAVLGTMIFWLVRLRSRNRVPSGAASRANRWNP